MISIERAYELRAMIEQAVTSLSDADAETVPELFPMWASGITYAVGDRVQSELLLYKCVQAHTSQDDWEPAVTPALWVSVHVEEFPEWVQPTGSHDAYGLGDKVSYNGKHWVSDVDANTWEPGIYGWSEVS